MSLNPQSTLELPGISKASQSAVASGTLVLSSLSFLEAGTRLVFNMAVVAMFGLSSTTDAFFLAQTLPLFISSLMLTTFVNGMVPVLAGPMYRSTDHQSTVFSTFLNLTFVFSLPLSIVGIGIAEGIIQTIGPGLDENTSRMAINLIRVLFVASVFGTASEVVRAAFYSMRRYAPPALCSIVRDLIAIITIFILRTSMGIEAAALGFVIGSMAQFFMVFCLLRFYSSFRYRMSIEWRNPVVREAAGLALAPLIGVGSRQGVVLFKNAIASFLPAGSVAALGLAVRIIHLIMRMLLGSVETSLLPVISSDRAHGRDDQLSENLAYGFKLSLFIATPVAVGLWLLSTDVTALLFERGNFDSLATLAVGQLLGLFALGVVFSGMTRVSTSYFYATFQAKAAVIMHMGASILEVILTLLLVHLMGLNGFGMAFTLSMAISAAVTYAYVHRQMGSPINSIRFTFLMRIAGTSLFMAGTISLVLMVARNLPQPWGRTISVVSACATGLLAYGLASRLLLPHELANLYKPVVRQGKRIFQRLQGKRKGLLSESNE